MADTVCRISKLDQVKAQFELEDGLLDKLQSFLIERLALARNLGFGLAELREVERVLRTHQRELLE